MPARSHHASINIKGVGRKSGISCKIEKCKNIRIHPMYTGSNWNWRKRRGKVNNRRDREGDLRKVQGQRWSEYLNAII